MSLERAIEAWTATLGSDRCRRDPELLARRSANLGARAILPAAVVSPRTLEEVVGVVRVAGAYEVALYPISTGLNWGMGAGAPIREGQVLVDLGGMDRILEVNEELCYAVVEPGVTQGQLADRLEHCARPLMMDVTASGRNTSLLGNIVERGDGFGPLGDRFANCAGMQVVLADGEVIDTGYAGEDAGSLGSAYKWGVGPSLDGLFSQSNFGIVTRVTMWLRPRPDRLVAFSVRVAQRRLGALVDALRELRLAETLQGAPHVYSALRTAEASSVPLEGAFEEKEAREIQGVLKADWTAVGGVWGSRREVAWRLAAIRHAMRGVGSMTTFGRGRVALLARARDVTRAIGMRSLSASLARVHLGSSTVLDLLSGRPTDVPVRSVARHSAHPVDETAPVDLRDYDDVGMYWLTHACPLTSDDALRAHEIIATTLREHRVPPQLTLTPVTARTLLCNTTIYFDRSSAERRESAHACQERLAARLVAAGYPPFRSGIHGMVHLGPASSPRWRLVRRLKEALDPGDVLAPGRYSPWEWERPAAGDLEPARAARDL